MWREKEGRMESSRETDGGRDGALGRVESESEKNAKMHAAASGWRIR